MKLERRKSFNENDLTHNRDRDRDVNLNRGRNWRRFTDQHRSQSTPPEGLPHSLEAQRADHTLTIDRFRVAVFLNSFIQDIDTNVQQGIPLSQEQIDTFNNHLVPVLRNFDNHRHNFADAGYTNDLPPRQIDHGRDTDNAIAARRQYLEPLVAQHAHQALLREQQALIQSGDRLAITAANHIQQEFHLEVEPSQDLVNQYENLVAGFRAYDTHFEAFNNSRHEVHLTDNQINALFPNADTLENYRTTIANVTQTLEQYYNNQDNADEPPYKKRKHKQ